MPTIAYLEASPMIGLIIALLIAVLWLSRVLRHAAPRPWAKHEPGEQALRMAIWEDRQGAIYPLPRRKG